MQRIEPGTDLRLPAYRREIFQRFYEFHLRYAAHPGGVYYLMRGLRERLGWDAETALWYAFLNGNTQHPPTSLMLLEAAPTWRHGNRAVALLDREWDRLPFDIDRRHHKGQFGYAVDGYRRLIAGAGSQERYWRDAAGGGWRGIWRAATAIPTFGRLSAWSYSEYLRIMGVDVECDDLMLGDRSGSRSHRNGICRVLGRDDLDWWRENPAFNGVYDRKTLAWLGEEAAGFLAEAQRRAAGTPWEQDVGYLTLESALCTYKSWHRPNRRYPNVYNDMLYDRLRTMEARWPERDWALFWELRRAVLPEWARLEAMPTDPGLVPVKQNWYRETGEIPMMGHDWPELWSEFDTGVAEGRYGVRVR
jgi:hypothetical protein